MKCENIRSLRTRTERISRHYQQYAVLQSVHTVLLMCWTSSVDWSRLI